MTYKIRITKESTFGYSKDDMFLATNGVNQKSKCGTYILPQYFLRAESNKDISKDCSFETRRDAEALIVRLLKQAGRGRSRLKEVDFEKAEFAIVKV